MNNLKVIHRIYFGFDGKPDPYGDYLKTWKKQLPGYEIKYWDASNLPMDINDYVISLYEKKDGVFLGDYFRWYLLREYGGIYLDADIEVVDGYKFNQLIEELKKSLDYDAIVGLEKNGLGYTAHSVASKPRSDLSIFMTSIYENMGKLYHWRRKYFTAPHLMHIYFFDNNVALENEGAIKSFEPVVELRVKVYPQDYFSPLSYGPPTYLEVYSENTCLCHHFGAAWVNVEHPSFNHSIYSVKRAKMLHDYLVSNSMNIDTNSEDINEVNKFPNGSFFKLSINFTGIYCKIFYIHIKFLFINLTIKITDEKLKRILWWLPIRKYRDIIRNMIE